MTQIQKAITKKTYGILPMMHGCWGLAQLLGAGARD